MKNATQRGNSSRFLGTRRTTGLLATGLLAILVIGAAAAAQKDPVVPVSKEPHHHLAFQNGYVQVFRVAASYGDDVRMHRHEYDMLSIQQGATDTTVHYQDKPDVHQQIADGQLRYQLAGIVHSTEVMKPDLPFNNNTIALLHSQSNKHNVCGMVLAGEPLSCPAGAKDQSEVPQFASDQTVIGLVSVGPHQQVALSHPGQPELVVSLRDAEVECRSGADAKSATPVKTIHARGDFVWIDAAQPVRIFVNRSDQDVHLVTMVMKP